MNEEVDEFLNKTFGKLTVINKFGIRKKRTHYNCRCECGNITLVASSKLKNGKTKSCGCINVERFRLLGKGNKLPPGVAARNKVISTYIHGAKTRKIKMELSKDDLLMFLNGDCFYCGRAPYTLSKSTIDSDESFLYNGIDRKNNDLGYSLGNSVSCCYECNYKKSSQNYDDFINWILICYNHLKLTGEVDKIRDVGEQYKQVKRIK